MYLLHHSDYMYMSIKPRDTSSYQTFSSHNSFAVFLITENHKELFMWIIVIGIYTIRYYN